MKRLQQMLRFIHVASGDPVLKSHCMLVWYIIASKNFEKIVIGIANNEGLDWFLQTFIINLHLPLLNNFKIHHRVLV